MNAQVEKAIFTFSNEFLICLKKPNVGMQFKQDFGRTLQTSRSLLFKLEHFLQQSIHALILDSRIKIVEIAHNINEFGPASAVCKPFCAHSQYTVIGLTLISLQKALELCSPKRQKVAFIERRTPNYPVILLRIFVAANITEEAA
jgi:hypothetical protein